MYAIVKTGGKQYRVKQGEWLLVERLAAGEGEQVALEPLLYVDGEELLDGEALNRVKVTATVLAHERGPKLRVVKFKPKRGYRRRTGHRQELTRIRISEIALSGAKSRARKAPEKVPAPVAAAPPEAAPAQPVTEDSDGA